MESTMNDLLDVSHGETVDEPPSPPEPQAEEE
jgi:hypothetical protein